MTYLKLLTATGLSLALVSAVVTNDVYSSQAQTKKFGNCSRPCWFRFKGSRIGGGRREIIEAIEALIKSGQATVDDYLILGDTYKLEGNYDLAQQRLSQGLELAKNNGDTEGQALAHNGLAEVFTATGRVQEASSNLTAAKSFYTRIGNQQGINKVNQQLRTLNQLQFDPSRIQVDPSRIQQR